MLIFIDPYQALVIHARVFRKSDTPGAGDTSIWTPQQICRNLLSLTIFWGRENPPPRLRSVTLRSTSRVFCFLRFPGGGPRLRFIFEHTHVDLCRSLARTWRGHVQKAHHPGRLCTCMPQLLAEECIEFTREVLISAQCRKVSGGAPPSCTRLQEGEHEGAQPSCRSAYPIGMLTSISRISHGFPLKSIDLCNIMLT